MHAFSQSQYIRLLYYYKNSLRRKGCHLTQLTFSRSASHRFCLLQNKLLLLTKVTKFVSQKHLLEVLKIVSFASVESAPQIFSRLSSIFCHPSNVIPCMYASYYPQSTQDLIGVHINKLSDS